MSEPDDNLMWALFDALEQETVAGGLETEEGYGGWYSTKHIAESKGLSMYKTRRIITHGLNTGALERAKRPRIDSWGDRYMCQVVRRVKDNGSPSPTPDA